MVCDRCGEARAEGSAFCPWCGEDLRDDCPMCQSHRDAGDAYCGSCGKRLAAADRKPSVTSSLGSAARWIVPFVLVLLMVELAYMLLGTFDVLEWAEDGSMSVLALVPVLVSVGSISGTALQVFWIILEAAIVTSVAVLAWQSWGTMREGGRLQDTPVYSTSVVFGASIAASMILSLLLASVGSGIETPDDMELGTTAESLLSYADAAVWEEVIARVVWIGIPMTVAALLSRKEKPWRMLLGGFGYSRLSVVLIVVSAAIFGFAHMSGWGIEKVLPTFVSGLLLGYAYVRIGLHASIVIHFLTDYLAVVLYTDLMVPMALLAWIVIILGVVCLAYMVLRLRGAGKRLREMPNWMPPDQESIFSSRDRD